jgi:solute carrier family 6 (neurotransmitter transporter)
LKLEESIPDYYNGQVLLRSSPNYPQTFSGELRFQTLFHIIVIWMSVFIGLSKGLKSYGKVVYIFSIASLLGFSVFAIKVIGLLPFESFKFWINSTHWLDLLHNGDVSSFLIIK